MVATIIENGIRVYKNYYCHCPCHARIPWHENHKYPSIGIPHFLVGHRDNDKVNRATHYKPRTLEGKRKMSKNRIRKLVGY